MSWGPPGQYVTNCLIYLSVLMRDYTQDATHQILLDASRAPSLRAGGGDARFREPLNKTDSKLHRLFAEQGRMTPRFQGEWGGDVCSAKGVSG
jgi:hypothetical protein